MERLRIFRERRVFQAYWRAILFRDGDGKPGIGFEWRLTQEAGAQLVMAWSYADLERIHADGELPAIVGPLMEVFGAELQASIDEFWAEDVARELRAARSEKEG